MICSVNDMTQGVTGPLPAQPARLYDNQTESQHPRAKNLRPNTVRGSNWYPASGIHGLDISLTQPNRLEHAVRIAEIARDRLLAASREEQRIYSSLLSAEGALRDAGGLLRDEFEEVPYRNVVEASAESQGHENPRKLVRDSRLETSSVKATRPMQPIRTGSQDTDGLRDVLEQVSSTV